MTSPVKRVMRDLGSLFSGAALWLLRCKKHRNGSAHIVAFFSPLEYRARSHTALERRQPELLSFRCLKTFEYLDGLLNAAFGQPEYDYTRKSNCAWELEYNCHATELLTTPLRHIFGYLTLSHDSQTYFLAIKFSKAVSWDLNPQISG